jgi:lysophospholipase L1-like esterase
MKMATSGGAGEVDESPWRSTRRRRLGVLAAVVLAALLVPAGVEIAVIATRKPKPTVAVVGDSITLLAGADISTALSHGYRSDVKAQIGKRIDQMLPTLAEELRTHPFAVVVNLGTNDAEQATTHPDWRSGFARMVELLGPARCVVLTTIGTLVPGSAPRTVASQINGAIAGAVSSHQNFHVVDWNAAVRGANGGSLLGADRVHPSTAGELTLAALSRAVVDDACANG